MKVKPFSSLSSPLVSSFSILSTKSNHQSLVGTIPQTSTGTGYLKEVKDWVSI